MFSWICQKCGSEVPPSYNECPNCAEVVAPPAEKKPIVTRSSTPPPPPPQPVLRQEHSTPQTFARPSQAHSQEQSPGRPPKPAGFLFGPGGNDFTGEGLASRPIPPTTPQSEAPLTGFAPPSSHSPQPTPVSPIPPPPASSGGLPSWLLMILVALLVGGIVAGAVWLKKRSGTAAPESTSLAGESAPTASSSDHRYARFIELGGFRIAEDAKRRATLQVAITNHHTADLGPIELEVILKTNDGKEIGSSEVKLTSLEPLSTVDVTAPMKSKLRAYEVPDWQFIRAQFEIKSK